MNEANAVHDDAGSRPETPAGHVLFPRAAGCIIEAWGPDRASCVRETLIGMVESFAVVPDAPAARLVPLAADPAGPEDLLVDILEDVIYAMDVFGTVPVRFHLAETEEGGMSGDMEMVDAADATIVGPVPTGVSHHDLSVERTPEGWRTHVLVDG